MSQQISAAIARSGLIERAFNPVLGHLSHRYLQIPVFAGAVMLLSMVTKNIGALAIMIPIAFQMAQRSNVSPSMFLMPMAFASLLGGLMTQIGTSPNIIVSRLRQDLTGTSFEMFDFTAMGLPLTVAGIVFLVLFYFLLPKRERKDLAVAEARARQNSTSDAAVGASSSVLDKTVSDLQKLAGGKAMVTSIVTGKGLRRTPFPDAVLRDGDRVIIEGEPEALDRMIDRGGLSLSDREHARGLDLSHINISDPTRPIIRSRIPS